MNRADPLFKLRLPDHLRQALEMEATKNRRSLTAEILGRLEMSLTETTDRLMSLEAKVFSKEIGNEALLLRVVEAEALLKQIIKEPGGDVVHVIPSWLNQALHNPKSDP